VAVALFSCSWLATEKKEVPADDRQEKTPKHLKGKGKEMSRLFPAGEGKREKEKERPRQSAGPGEGRGGRGWVRTRTGTRMSR